MTPSSEKLVKSLSNFLAQYRELEDAAYEGISEEDESDEAAVASNDAYEKIVGTLKETLGTVLEREPYSTEEIAGAMSCLLEALEEIDPDLFAESAEDADELDDDEEGDDLELDEDEEIEDKE